LKKLKCEKLYFVLTKKIDIYIFGYFIYSNLNIFPIFIIINDKMETAHKCCICLDEISINNLMQCNKCNGYVCQKCLDEMIAIHSKDCIWDEKINHRCPLCRYNNEETNDEIFRQSET
jgi:hypothetical protein